MRVGKEPIFQLTATLVDQEGAEQLLHAELEWHYYRQVSGRNVALEYLKTLHLARADLGKGDLERKINLGG